MVKEMKEEIKKADIEGETDKQRVEREDDSLLPCLCVSE